MREKEEVEIVDFLIQVKDCMVSRSYCCAAQYFDSKISVSQLTACPSIRHHGYYFFAVRFSVAIHCKNRLVVLTTEWLHWLHGFFLVSEAIV